MNKQVELLKAAFDDLQTIWEMQVEAFSELYEKYHDAETSPATEKRNQPRDGENRQDHLAFQSTENDVLFHRGGR